jgi:hypothetical protein
MKAQSSLISANRQQKSGGKPNRNSTNKIVSNVPISIGIIYLV